MLGSTGGIAGGLVAWWTLRALPLIAPADLPRLEGIHFDVRSLVFATAVSLLTTVTVGSLPVWQMPRSDLVVFAASPGVR